MKAHTICEATPSSFIPMVRQLRDGVQANVQNDDELSEPFPVTYVVKPGV